MKTIVVTGGGSGGHIAPIRAIAPELLKTKKIIWIGSSMFEENAAHDLGISFKKILSGKFRRGISLKNIIKNILDMVLVELAGWQSIFFLFRKKPEYIFSTGGFVSVPVVVAGWILGIPIIIHEQSIGFGLANKVGSFCAKKILLAFPESYNHVPEQYREKIEMVGNPIRQELIDGNFSKLQSFLGNDLNDSKPILYVTGGGQGSESINNFIFESLDELTKKYYLIHQTGKNGIERAKKYRIKDYFPFAFVGIELADIYASTDLIIARSGAGTVNELDHFGIPSIFIPLRPVQDDEQTKNAQWFLQRNSGLILHQDQFKKRKILDGLNELENSELRRNNKIESRENSTVEKIVMELDSLL